MKYMKLKQKKRHLSDEEEEALHFHKINFNHPIKEKCPFQMIEYKARKRSGGQVYFFNFDLAKEIGLIGEKLTKEMSSSLESEILDYFSYQIINEYDIINKTQVREESRLPHTVFATRYLQLQHLDNQGKNSGDGRGSWIGTISRGGKTWDISANGTGATRLSPATHKYSRYFKSGDPSISYGCGHAELSEATNACIMSEYFNQLGFPTERYLAVIKFPNQTAIFIRVAPNLLRPSHFFLHLKQNNLRGLEDIFNHYIKREKSNKRIQSNNRNDQLHEFLENIVHDFAKASATYEMEHIFVWMDWDGDNILCNGGIIDYGSIRKFGACYKNYKFDDDGRWSTTLLQQKGMAKKTVLYFLQAVEYIQQGIKRPIDSYKGHEIEKIFDDIFKQESCRILLRRFGIPNQVSDQIILDNTDLSNDFLETFQKLERINLGTKLIQASDGVYRPCLYNMRIIILGIRKLMSSEASPEKAIVEQVLNEAILEEAQELNAQPANEHIKLLSHLYSVFKKIFEIMKKEQNLTHSKAKLKVLTKIVKENGQTPLTGDGVITLANKIVTMRGMDAADRYELIKNILFQLTYNSTGEEISDDRVRPLIQIVEDLKEGI